MANLEGRELGDCVLVQYVDKGSFGYVYTARLKDTEAGKTGYRNEIYAAKILSLDNATDRHRELVKREIDILKPLNHPNIVQYKYHVVVDKTACLVMEYCSGGTLYQHIRDLKRDSKVMGEKEFLLTLTQISKGVEFLHDSSIIHRDLKTKNMLYTDDKKVIKIGDFGVARLTDISSKKSVLVGTPYYLSPEILEEKPYDEKTDIWSLGCTCYEMATGSYAFYFDTMETLKEAVCRGKLPESPSISYNDDIQNMIKQMMSKISADRPTIKQILKFLQEPHTYKPRTRSMDEKTKKSNRKFWEKESERLQKTLIKNLDHYQAPEILVKIKKMQRKGVEKKEIKREFIRLVGDVTCAKLFPLVDAMDCLERGIREFEGPRDLDLSFTGTFNITPKDN
ncbi:serine/threonine-protein kinase Nek4-like isoform X2 [Ostrea edulis]|uniref:serine/threonine-protein kinase Nek4-like isoform X2 n=1 Tax=Ostrea edulis TaxID=37623 RepID=UPI0020961DB2|nr:serine/threonine-protein kinase Nek4-like isoform X2 [Ostrea edulis]